MNRILLSAVAFGLVGTLTAQVQSYAVGATVADFTVTDTDGDSHSLYSYTAQGKYVLLDFFFDTCPPCQSTTPIFNEFHDKYGCNTGDVAAISMNNGSDSDAEVIAFENSYGGSFAHAPAISADGGSGAVDSDFSIAAYPTYTLIAPDNTMLVTDIWPLSDVSSLEAAFPSGSINPMPCAPQSVNDINADITSIFPNPTTGQVTITLGNVSSNMTIEVYDVLGKIVTTASLNVNSTEQNLDLSSLENGHYMVKLMSGADLLDIEQVVLNK